MDAEATPVGATRTGLLGTHFDGVFAFANSRCAVGTRPELMRKAYVTGVFAVTSMSGRAAQATCVDDVKVSGLLKTAAAPFFAGTYAARRDMFVWLMNATGRMPFSSVTSSLRTVHRAPSLRWNSTRAFATGDWAWPLSSSTCTKPVTLAPTIAVVGSCSSTLRTSL